MKAITVKYLGPTDTKPSRLKVFDMDGNSMTASKDGMRDSFSQAKDLAREFIDSMDWFPNSEYKLRGGAVKNADVFVIEVL